MYYPPPVIPPPSLTCTFAILGSALVSFLRTALKIIEAGLESVFYNGTNVTDLVEELLDSERLLPNSSNASWENSSYFRIKLVEIPDAILAFTATANSTGDACSTASFQRLGNSLP